MRVHVVDPSAYTPPYDHALCRALAVAGADVELVTSRFAYGPVAAPDGYVRREPFYRVAFGAPGGRVRMACKLVEHVPDMLHYRHMARNADVVHFQWLALQHVDRHLLPTGRPLVLTGHDVLPREPRPGQLAAQRRLYDRFDAIVVHSEHGRSRLVDELGADPDRVHVIAHGVFTHLAEGATVGERGNAATRRDVPADGLIEPRVVPAETVSRCKKRGPVHARIARVGGTSTSAERSIAEERSVVLMFGLMRPYKGIDVLIDAWRGVDGEAPLEHAELWIAGMPKMDISALRAVAPANVRFVPRFITDDELPAYFERADLVVLPYLQADQSGVLFTALAFGKPLLLSDVGGFPELASTGAARVVPAGDARALGRALRELLADRAALTKMCVKARAAASGLYSWERIAGQTLALYRSL